ncbi:MAG: hypothetical protein ABR531_04260, partial [Bacteroidales bacterium]
MIIGILKEAGNEDRVAILPSETAALLKLKLELMVEEGAGAKAFASDEEYRSAGATTAGRKEIIARADLLFTVNPPLNDDVSSFREGQMIFTVLDPVENRE